MTNQNTNANAKNTTEQTKDTEKLAQLIESNLSQARFILDQANDLVAEALCLFEIDLSVEQVYRFRPETPYYFDRVAAWLAAGRLHLAELADSSVVSDEALHLSSRAPFVSRLVEAQIKANLACAYVEYWDGAKAVDNFKVLADQAVAYAQCVTESNWWYFAPLVFIRPQEPLAKKSEAQLRRLSGYGEAALAYVKCFHAQMLLAPMRMQQLSFEPLLVNKSAVKQPVTAAQWPQLNAFNSNLEDLTQQEIAEIHILATGQNMREDHWLGISQFERGRVYVKQRLVGFDRSRGGKSHKKNSAKAT